MIPRALRVMSVYRPRARSDVGRMRVTGPSIPAASEMYPDQFQPAVEIPWIDAIVPLRRGKKPFSIFVRSLRWPVALPVTLRIHLVTQEYRAQIVVVESACPVHAHGPVVRHHGAYTGSCIRRAVDVEARFDANQGARVGFGTECQHPAGDVPFGRSRQEGSRSVDGGRSIRCRQGSRALAPAEIDGR